MPHLPLYNVALLDFTFPVYSMYEMCIACMQLLYSKPCSTLSSRCPYPPYLRGICRLHLVSVLCHETSVVAWVYLRFFFSFRVLKKGSSSFRCDFVSKRYL